jgi:adenylate cyclase
MGILVSVGVTAASALGYLDAPQARSLDLLMRLRDRAPVSDVVIVAVDEAAFEAVGYRQPLPRDYLAKVIEGIRRSGAAVIGLDVALSNSTSVADDTALATAITKFSEGGLSRVVTVVAARPPAGRLGDPSVQDVVVRGVAEVPEESDGVIRRTPLGVKREHRGQPAFGLAVLARMGGLDQGALERALGGPRPELLIPMWRPGTGWLLEGEPLDVSSTLERINFVGPAGTFLTIPSGAVAALADPKADVATDNPLRGRIVLVGATFEESRDFYMTPHGKLSGVEIHANIVHMIATRTFIRPTGWVLGLGVQVVLVLIGALLFTAINPLVGTVACLVAAVAIGLPASYLIFDRGHYWLDFMLPVFATRVMGWGVDLLDRPHLRKVLDRYIGPRPVQDVSGERCELTILVARLLDFAALSEHMESETVATQLRDYGTAVSQVVLAHGGTIELLAGDLVVAAFGIPAAGGDHPARAVRAATAMHDALRGLNEQWIAAGRAPLRIGIGVHTGQVVVVTIGDSTSFAPRAVVGLGVELALQTQALTMELDTRILITGATRAAIGEQLIARDHGTVTLKALGEEVPVYEPLSFQ